MPIPGEARGPSGPAAREAAGDPYAAFAELRGSAPAVAEEVELTEDGGRRQWFGVYRWDAVRAALGDDAFSAEPYQEHMGLDRRYGPVLIGMDAPEHRGHRAVLQPSFSRASVAGALRAAVTGPIDEVLDDLAPDGAADLLPQLCEPIPALVLCRLLALPDHEAAALCAQALVLTAPDRALAHEASDALYERLLPVIHQRRRDGGDDLISVLARGSVDGRALEDVEVFSHVRLLAIAGTDTVTRAIANLLFALLSHPEQLRTVQRDPARAPAAVEEAIRWECPALSVPRLARRRTCIGGVEIPEGAAVRCCLGAANRDPARWRDPDRFDISRPPLANAGLGIGVHACLGAHLAHQIMEQVLLGVLARLPAVELDPQGAPAAMVGTHLRAPTHLRVRW